MFSGLFGHCTYLQYVRCSLEHWLHGQVVRRSPVKLVYWVWLSFRSYERL